MEKLSQKNTRTEQKSLLTPSATLNILSSLKNTESNNPSYEHWDFLSGEFKQDRDIALAAFIYGHVMQGNLPDQWKHDHSFFLEAVGEKPSCWYNLSEEYQRDPMFVRNFPEFGNKNFITRVFEKIPALRHDHEIWDTIISSNGFDRRDLRDLAPISVLNDRELMLKVCQKKFGGILSVGDALKLDRDFLLQAIDANPRTLWDGGEVFKCMSDLLKGDKNFVWKLMGHKPNDAYWCASDEIQADYRVQVKGLASSNFFASNFSGKLRKNEAGRVQLRAITSRSQSETESFETFMTTILLGISLPADEESHCPLTLLNQGTETSVAYKRLIMEYAGVPNGRKLRKVRRAHKRVCLAEQELDEFELSEANLRVFPFVDNRSGHQIAMQG